MTTVGYGDMTYANLYNYNSNFSDYDSVYVTMIMIMLSFLSFMFVILSFWFVYCAVLIALKCCHLLINSFAKYFLVTSSYHILTKVRNTLLIRKQKPKKNYILFALCVQVLICEFITYFESLRSFVSFHIVPFRFVP